MDSATAKMAPQTSLFQVFLRLRPPQNQKLSQIEPWLIVEPPSTPDTTQTEGEQEVSRTRFSTHITLQPPNDSRKRAIERFGFTKIFEEEASQVDVFDESGTAESIRHLLQRGRDGLVATLGVTGSGKSHTILGTKTQRGLTQMTLDVLFRSIGPNIRKTNCSDIVTSNDLLSALQASDPSEAQILSARAFLDMVYDNGDRVRMSRAQTPMGYGSRANTPMMVRTQIPEPPGSFPMSPLAVSRMSQVVHLSPGGSQMHTSLYHPIRPDSSRTSVRAAADESLEQNLSSGYEHSAEKAPWRPPSKIPFWSRLSPKKTQVMANTFAFKDTIPNHRKPPMPQPSTFAQSPDVSQYIVDVDRDADYAVLISMYEVYNDRIFDLLTTGGTSNGPTMSTRAGTALQKGLMRRPLLFKNTELSQDRKVVAGLRKIVCNSYDEAMMVLETGLMERRVAGTGSNSVSSRSHGFFCIEVKKNSGNRHFHSHSDWVGGTISIADLAGSERARNAKTTGSTLAEAGKINESLMYLGQCLQVQSDCQQDGSKPIVPFRQCKLTELLFSNSFPSQSHQATPHRAPQKAIMIVTADPQGDFNATSQILRYSALAREVTVPRIPSVTSIIINSGKQHQTTGTAGDRYNSNEQFLAATSQELEQATNEVRRLAEECDALAVRLTEEEIKRTESELKLQAAEERIASMEQDIREDCWQEMELMMQEEKERWRTAWEEQRMRGEEYLDGKIDILEKTSQFKIHNDTDTSTRVDELERENEVLKAKLAALEQEMVTRSPTKRTKSSCKTTAPATLPVLQEAHNTNTAVNPFIVALMAKENELMLKPTSGSTGDEIDVFEVSPRKLSLRSSNATKIVSEEPATTKKKTRKLTTRKWDTGDESEL